MYSRSSWSKEHNAPVITLRGVRTSNVTELGDPAVGTHVDGIYVTRGVQEAANALMFDVERVELSEAHKVLCLEQIQLAKTTILLQLNQILRFQGGSLTLNSGRYNEAGVQAHYNLPVTDNNLALRLHTQKIERILILQDTIQVLSWIGELCLRILKTNSKQYLVNLKKHSWMIMRGIWVAKCGRQIVGLIQAGSSLFLTTRY